MKLEDLKETKATDHYWEDIPRERALVTIRPVEPEPTQPRKSVLTPYQQQVLFGRGNLENLKRSPDHHLGAVCD